MTLSSLTSPRKEKFVHYLIVSLFIVSLFIAFHVKISPNPSPLIPNLHDNLHLRHSWLSYFYSQKTGRLGRFNFALGESQNVRLRTRLGAECPRHRSNVRVN